MVGLRQFEGPSQERPVRQPAIVEVAEHRLRASGYLVLRNVSCQYSDGTLTLCGYLPTYHLRQVVLAAVAGIRGVEHILDNIEIRPTVGWGRQN
jgi:hypothetical protein